MQSIDFLMQNLEQSNNLPTGTLKALMLAESGGNPKAVSPKGAQGAFQFMPKTAQEFGGNPWDVSESAKMAAKKLGGLYKASGNNLEAALAKWNEGEGNFAKRGGMKNLPKETQDFERHVLNNMEHNPDYGMVPQQPNMPQGAPQPAQSPGMDMGAYQSGLQNLNQQQVTENQQFQQQGSALLNDMQQQENNIPAYKSIEIPEYKPQPPYTSQEFSDFSMALVAMSVLGGIASGGKNGYYWMNAADSLNKSTQLWMDRKYKEAEDKRAQFDEQFKVAQEKQKAYNEEYNSIIHNRELSLGQIRDKLNFLATVHHDNDALIAAQKGDLYHLMELGQKRDQFLENLDYKNKTLAARVTYQTQQLELGRQRVHEAINRVTSLSQPAKDQLGAMQMGIMDIDSLIKQATEDPDLLKAAAKLPFIKDADQLEMAYKSGAFSWDKYVTADPGTEEYTKQVAFWREMEQMVERYTSATMKQRSMAAIQFMRSIKAQPTDRPDVAMAIMHDFRRNIEKELYDSVTLLNADPHHKVYADAALEGSGYTLDMLKKDLQQVGGWQDPATKQQEIKTINTSNPKLPPTSLPVPQLGNGESKQVGNKTYKNLGGKMYVKENGQWHQLQ